MPKCLEMTEIATDYMEGALPLRRAVAARAHLLVCKLCSAYYDQLRKARTLLRNRALGGPSVGDEARLLSALRIGNGES